MKKRKLPMALQTTAKRRLKIHREALPEAKWWAERFGSEGEKSRETLSIQLKSIEQLERRIARLDSYVRRSR